MVGVLKPRVKQLKFHSETYSKCPNAHKKFDWEQGTHICHDLCYTEETITDTSLGTDYKFTVDFHEDECGNFREKSFFTWENETVGTLRYSKDNLR